MNTQVTDRSGGNELGTSLKPRHITMISIAGVIVAGLFVGSANAIKLAGPAVLISYTLAGLLVILVMRMLGEMATAQPDTGSFSTYAERALGRWAGCSIGWLYWLFWVLVIPVEATAAAVIMAKVVGGPQWSWALLVVVLLTVTNLLSVGNYGEFEFWFALIKVLAIVAFLVLGVLAILGLLPGSGVSGVHHLWDTGGFMPNGASAVIAAMLTTMFTFMGSEIVTIAAAESPEPAKGITRAVNSVVWRICLFYLGSIFVVVALVPWNSLDSATGSYQAVLTAMNIPAAAGIMDVVVLVAVASCLNSALYTASRMLYSLAQRGDAPRAAGRTTSRGVPAVSVLASMLLGFLAVIGNYVLPEKLFGYLLATTGAVALFVYLVIALSQIALRRRATEPSPLRMWFFPWATYAVIAFIVFIIVAMIIDPSQRSAVGLSTGLAVFVVAASLLHQRRMERRSASASS
ncbi:Amino acid permease-associated region OS=Tsukamurella paurometabola (strain ATCC 8368 / DSM/ CCUG 35730 / CIP 100753 / JCM 10117 / KCTC 9821 / NBRC 16120/ NCIMB 702349 / NCTC 13040) OX=521096 GN=Tpau_3570 PE=3 SV=1 [Tsukamurella paurometabola]|uniref:Amino acid permease-associated region n=1 Tax=Tsukamurella paurometabola (strain ATCC 8368 / DSM 20162 / CCUG 35730 / CIP 100753 / JCM 10117 / KCTC 9821 / NBRC 16120 / NCIMB 702349 / NCTC 13040) TaxID=521096 RepID=D5UXC9_TSUPD|nr:amino acid permease [Tsukamurella paurometabola]ADG80148.1 amino acid permease-associated region [Tsukamurella paurometabola DSM 20162]SUP38603.1 Gamma-aminobutyrate permease [Tsukamurella paurometabola]